MMPEETPAADTDTDTDTKTYQDTTSTEDSSSSSAVEDPNNNKFQPSTDTDTDTGTTSTVTDTDIPRSDSSDSTSTNTTSSSFLFKTRNILRQASSTTISTAQTVSASAVSSISNIDYSATASVTASKVRDIAGATQSTVQNIAHKTQPAVSSLADNISNIDVSAKASAVANVTHTTASQIARKTQPTMQSFADNLNSIIPTRRYTLPDRSVASQILMYRQLLHTECKPGLRLSRNFEGTDAQKKVMHMPWWEGGVETSKKMVISYDNLIVRVWLGGAIMPYVDGGYAEEYKSISVPKDDDAIASNNTASKGAADGNDAEGAAAAAGNTGDAVVPEDKVTKKESGNDASRPNHIDTLIDSKGLPPIPHVYWVDRLGFQQTDPVTDFRSGGVLSLAMLAHIVEACPNVHARFLPSGDAHMLPFGITCINVTDMIAKFCMFSKSVERMDVLMSQKPFWKMFENPDSLLVLQELCMEILCNVVVEMKRERNIPKVEDVPITGEMLRFEGQQGQKDVTVFDFAEILSITEKRVNDDLLGGGPRSVDELRTIHSRNCTKYMRAIERKEYQGKRAVERAIERSKSSGAMGGGDTMNSTEDLMKGVAGNVGNVLGSAGGVFSKFKGFGLKKSTPSKSKSSSSVSPTEMEEIEFAKAPETNISSSIQDQGSDGGKNKPSSALDEAQDLLNSVDVDLDTKAEETKKQFADLLGDSPTEPADYFTIDDDDLI